MSTLKERSDFLWEEIANNFTPDMARLRYEGPINVFLYGTLCWDHSKLQDFNKENSLTFSEDIQTCVYKTETVGSFCLYKTKSNTNAASLPHFSDYLFLKPGLNSKVSARRVRGKLVQVSLKGLMALDRYYFNTVCTKRIQIKLESSLENHQTAYTYLFKQSHMFSDGALKKTLNIRPALVETSAKGSFYT